MTQHASIERKSFVASFELIAEGKSFAPCEIAPDFITLRTPATVPLGPAELIIRYDDQPDTVRRQIIVTGSSPDDPLHIHIQRP